MIIRTREIKMETREIKQVKVWTLLMNNMKGKPEDFEVALASTNKNSIIEYYNNSKIEMYEEPHPSGGTYKKQFKSDSVLYWFNSCHDEKTFNDFVSSNEKALDSEWLHMVGFELFKKRIGKRFV